jgi:mono/diheme cytochrome c family protein
MRAQTLKATLAGAILLGVGACGATHEAPPAANTAPVNANTAVVTNANTAPTPPSASGSDMAQAAQLYDTNCASCHLQSGKGDPHHKKDDIPDFTNAAWLAKEPDAELHRSIENGHGKVMPAFGSSLSGAQIDALIAYIRTFPTRTGTSAGAQTSATPATPAAKGPEPKPGASPKAAPAKNEAHDNHGGHDDHHTP